MPIMQARPDGPNPGIYWRRLRYKNRQLMITRLQQANECLLHTQQAQPKCTRSPNQPCPRAEILYRFAHQASCSTTREPDPQLTRLLARKNTALQDNFKTHSSHCCCGAA